MTHAKRAGRQRGVDRKVEKEAIAAFWLDTHLFVSKLVIFRETQK